MNIGLRLRGVILSVFVVLSAFGHACAWDYDTLTEEAKGLPNVVDAIVGRVRIYPPEYYELRIKLSGESLKKNPLDLGALDNLIVAHDRLGRYDEALRYAELKQKALASLPKSQRGDHEYRYFSNLGTVQAHKALSTSKVNFDQLNLAIKSLESGLKINPQAHFGREKYQVELYRLLISHYKKQPKLPKTPTGPELEALGQEQSRAAKIWEEFSAPKRREKTQEAVLGMIAMGDGPESPVLIRALQSSLAMEDGYLAELADLRLKELQPADGLLFERALFESVTDEMKGPLQTQFDLLRKDADTYREKLNSFIKIKVAKGLHPDNDPTFWDDWQEPQRVNIQVYEPVILMPGLMLFRTQLVAGVIVFLLGFRGFKFVLKRWRAKKS